MENKSKGNENKILLGDFNCTMYKMDRDVVPIIACQNSFRIIDSRIYVEGRIQILLSLPTGIDPLVQDSE